MNSKHILLNLAVVMATAFMAAGQSGGPFTLSSNTRDGGGPCTGGVTPTGGVKFSLSGTVGQPDAGGSMAGTYVQQGGFIPAFTLPVTPRLNMSHSGNTFTFTWPNSCMGYVLEESTSPNGPVWTSKGVGTENNGNWQLMVPASPSAAFFRLRKDCPK